MRSHERFTTREADGLEPEFLSEQTHNSFDLFEAQHL